MAKAGYKFDEVKKLQWLQSYAKCKSVTQSCQSVDISTQTLYDTLKDDAYFKEQKDNIDNVVNDVVEQSLNKRALGFTVIEEKLTKDGEIVKLKKELPPDTLACMYWLNNRRPENWKNKVEHSGNSNEPIRFEIVTKK